MEQQLRRMGRLVVIDGLDGSGKSSVMAFLEERFRNRKILFTREPGDTPLGEKIKEFELSGELKRLSGFARFALHFASEASHLDLLVREALQMGKDVICKHLDSTKYGHQIFGEQHHGFRLLFEDMRRECLSGIHPHYIYLDVDPKVARQRKYDSDPDFDFQPLEYYERVHKGYLEFFTMHKSHTVDANKPLAEVRVEVANIVESILA